jgi:hypothetical protein
MRSARLIDSERGRLRRMSEDPYRATTGGPLEYEADLGGATKRTRYQLSADALLMESVNGSASPKQMPLAEVVRVHLVTLGGVTICTLTSRGGKQLALSSGMPVPGDPGAERTFATLLEALNERIAVASPSAAFVTGSWALAGFVAVAILITGGALAWLARDPVVRGWLSFKVGCVVVALLVAVALPLALTRGRPRPYDPRKIPRRYDPAPR